MMNGMERKRDTELQEKMAKVCIWTLKIEKNCDLSDTVIETHVRWFQWIWWWDQKHAKQPMKERERKRDAHRNMHMVTLNHLNWMSVHPPSIFETHLKYASQRKKSIDERLHAKLRKIQEKMANKKRICITSYRIALEALTIYSIHACMNVGERTETQQTQTNSHASLKTLC